MNEKLFYCKHCGKAFTSKQKLGGHSNTCEKNPNHKLLLERLAYARTQINQLSGSSSETLTCPYCNKEFITNKGAFQMHIDYFCELNPNKKIEKLMKLQKIS